QRIALLANTLDFEFTPPLKVFAAAWPPVNAIGQLFGFLFAGLASDTVGDRDGLLLRFASGDFPADVFGNGFLRFAFDEWHGYFRFANLLKVKPKRARLPAVPLSPLCSSMY